MTTYNEDAFSLGLTGEWETGNSTGTEGDPITIASAEAALLGTYSNIGVLDETYVLDTTPGGAFNAQQFAANEDNLTATNLPAAQVTYPDTNGPGTLTGTLDTVVVVTVDLFDSTGTLIGDDITMIAHRLTNGQTFLVPSGSSASYFDGTPRDYASVQITAVTDVNASSDSLPNPEIDLICFASGTLIKTVSGETPVEKLTLGSRVMTLDAGYQPIRWIKRIMVSKADLEANPKLLPVRIQAGALGNGIPEQDLVVSPQHRVLVSSAIVERMFGVREVLIPAHKLVTIDGIDIDWECEGVEYWHFLFDAHQIVWSNGVPTESLFTGPEALKAVSPEAREEIITLFPELTLPGYMARSARHIPERGKHMKRLAQRHQKNRRPLVGERPVAHRPCARAAPHAKMET